MIDPMVRGERAASMRTGIRRGAGRRGNSVEHGQLRLEPGACRGWRDDGRVDLPRRELALLQVLLNNPTRVLSSDNLKDALYGFSEDVESNALNVHIHHLRRKLGNSIIETVRGLGYRLGPAGRGAES